MNKLKSEKLPIMGSYTSFNFISKFLQGIKYMIAFCSTVQKLSMVFFELEVSTVGRFQNRICTTYEGLLTLNNSKSEDGQGDY